MEDADKAINKAKKILGNNFDFSIDNSLPFRFDAAKLVMVYVYGVCTSNGIRLFRDAIKNKIKKTYRTDQYHGLLPDRWKMTQK